ncbi:MAG: phosphate acyltransferase, partial [Bacteroidota bacterium]
VDPRLISTVAPAVARAAMDSGVAQHPIKDWEAYQQALIKRMGNDQPLSKIIETKARQDLKRVVFADAEDLTVLKAVRVVMEEGIAAPMLLGNKVVIQQMLQELEWSPENLPMLDPSKPVDAQEEERLATYTEMLYEKRKRKGMTEKEAKSHMRTNNYFGAMMVEQGDADAMIGGLSSKYSETVRPALQIIGAREGVQKVASTHIILAKSGPLFLADTAINHHLEANDIANIAELAAHQARIFNLEPRIALVTYSNFGSVPYGESAMLMRSATHLLHERHPEWKIDGEMQAHLALDPEKRNQLFPFSKLGDEPANVLVFPNLSSANLAYNLLQTAADMEMIGPVLLGLKKPVHILQLGASVRQIVDMVGIAACHAQDVGKD